LHRPQNDRTREDFDRIASLSGDGDWDHNRHYHGFLLKQLPSRCGEVLEIGCGTGAFARLLAQRAERVRAVDLSPQMIQLAQKRSRELANLDFRVADAGDMDFPCERYDAIVSIATLHHLCMEETLVRMTKSLKVGGRLLILDLYQRAGVFDALTDLIAVPVGLVLRLINTGRLREPGDVRQAWEVHGQTDIYPSLALVRTICSEHLPGAQVRRHLLWRYSVVWEKVQSGNSALVGRWAP
jgi:ubiquinone/menaquinone biosynthesis C-methylase UbiE